MLNIYKEEQSIPQGVNLIITNDVYFNKHTVQQIDDRAKDIILQIDGAVLKGKYQILSGMNGELLNIDKLSTGCKTALNVFYNDNKVFSLKECGDNALDSIYIRNTGNVFCEYPIISFAVGSVIVHDQYGKRQIDSYEDLKGWWEDVQ